MDAICRRFQYNIGGIQIVDYSTEIAQRAALRVRSSKSQTWRSTVGSRAHVLSYAPEDLKKIVLETAGHHSLKFPGPLQYRPDNVVQHVYLPKSGNTQEDEKASTRIFAWQPPCSLFDIGHGIPGAYHQFTLNFNTSLCIVISLRN